MQADEIEMYLAELGQELQNQGMQRPIRVLLVGGAFMLTQLHSRATTNDVDVVLKDVDDFTTSSLYRSFKNAVRVVATRNNMPGNWLNDVIGDFLKDSSAVPEGTLWRQFAMLEVYVPASEYILALKLLAGRRKDEQDIRTLSRQLRVQTRIQAQQLLDRYIPQKQVQQINNVETTLNEFFP